MQFHFKNIIIFILIELKNQKSMNLNRILLLTILLSLSGHINRSLTAQNPVADGYMGIWYNTGDKTEYGYKLSGGFATFGSRHVPTAIYSSAAGKTFFVYGGTSSPGESSLRIMISYFDHRTGKVPKPVVVFDKGGVRSPYDNASLSIDSKGFLWVFVSGWMRTRPGLVFKSVTPWSTEKFEEVMIKEMSFPQPWWFQERGFRLLFSKYRKGLDLYISESADGLEWSGDRALVSMGGTGYVSAVNNNKIYIAFNYHPEGDSDRRTNLYLIYSDDFGKTWKNAEGKTIQTPLRDIKNEAMVRDYLSEKKLTYIYDINFDGDGNPVILACIGGSVIPGPSEIPREWVVVSRTGGSWSFSRVCEPDNNFDAGTLIIDKDIWKVIGPSEPGPQIYGVGGEIAVWISRDKGKTWSKQNDVTSGSRFNNSYVRRPLNAGREFYAWWADGDAYKFSESRIYFTDKSFGKVWMLPYSMSKDSEKPIRIK